MATEEQKLQVLSNLFPTPSFSFPIKDNTSATFEFIRNTYCRTPKFSATIPDMNSSPLQYIACWDGELLYYSGKFKNPELLLRLHPGTIAQLMDCIPENKDSINIVLYEDIDTNTLPNIIKNIIMSGGATEQEAEIQTDQFMSGNTRLPVKSGTSIGQCKSTEASVSISDKDNFYVHPVYILWRWIKLGMEVKPDNHPFMDEFDWHDMSLSLTKNYIYGAISNSMPIDISIGAYQRAGN